MAYIYNKRMKHNERKEKQIKDSSNLIISYLAIRKYQRLDKLCRLSGYYISLWNPTVELHNHDITLLVITIRFLIRTAAPNFKTTGCQNFNHVLQRLPISHRTVLPTSAASPNHISSQSSSDFQKPHHVWCLMKENSNQLIASQMVLVARKLLFWTSHIYKILKYAYNFTWLYTASLQILCTFPFVDSFLTF